MTGSASKVTTSKDVMYQVQQRLVYYHIATAVWSRKEVRRCKESRVERHTYCSLIEAPSVSIFHSVEVIKRRLIRKRLLCDSDNFARYET